MEREIDPGPENPSPSLSTVTSYMTLSKSLTLCTSISPNCPVQPSGLVEGSNETYSVNLYAHTVLSLTYLLATIPISHCMLLIRSPLGPSYTVLLLHFHRYHDSPKLRVQVTLHQCSLTVPILGSQPSGPLQWLEGVRATSLCSHRLSTGWPVTMKASLRPNSDTQRPFSSSRDRPQTTWLGSSAKSQLSYLSLEADVTRSLQQDSVNWSDDRIPSSRWTQDLVEF